MKKKVKKKSSKLKNKKKPKLRKKNKRNKIKRKIRQSKKLRKTKPKRRIKISRKVKLKYTKYINSTIVADYIINNTFDKNYKKNKYLWENK